MKASNWICRQTGACVVRLCGILGLGTHQQLGERNLAWRALLCSHEQEAPVVQLAQSLDDRPHALRVGIVQLGQLDLQIVS